MEDKKSMNLSAGFFIGLEKILDYLVEKEAYQAKVGNTTIRFDGTLEDTTSGKRQVFYVIRKVDW